MLTTKIINYNLLLNKQQLEAVKELNGPMLCIAGAGTGKTRTIIFRLAYMLDKGIAPENILLLTFTRKAAKNMLQKAAELIGDEALKISGGTYHSFASSILTTYSKSLGLKSDFSIADESDCIDIISHMRSIKGYKDKEQKFPDKKTLSKIFSKALNCNLSIKDTILTYFKRYDERIDEIKVLQDEYNKYKKNNSILDYDDLLLYLYNLLAKNEDIRDKICNQYKYIMADEYQDTNKLQAEITILLAGKNQNIMVVGDDAQSIYSFRGADINNIIDFPKYFKNCKIITLEQNYRSTKAILNSANKLISNTKQYYPKKLFSDIKSGTPPALVKCLDEQQQAIFIISRIIELYQSGIPLSDMAVLFRSASVSSILEVLLKQKGIPYVKWGGSNFLDTIHLKDFLAHIKILCNPNDRMSWYRVLNLLDGIGNTNSLKIFNIISSNPEPYNLSDININKKITESLKPLHDVLNKCSTFYNEKPIKILEYLSDYYLPILKNKFEDYKQRLKDIDKLSLIAENYENISDFLNSIDLNDNDNNINSETNIRPLVLSTIHSAKGMEWNTVFIMSALHGIFPSFASIKNPYSYEEERRLMYVAITRAKENLAITYPSAVWDNTTGNILKFPSDFIENIKDTLDIWQISG